MIDALAARLRGVLGTDKVISDRQQLRTYECDGLAHYKVIPALVAFPHTAAECARSSGPAPTRACRSWHAARAPACRAAPCHTPTASSSSPPRCGASSTVAPQDERAVVEPGVINLQVTPAASPHGYYYAPDPSSQQICSIGGNVAENSGGAHCLKYGFTTNHVTGAQIVVARRRAGPARRPGPGRARVRPARRVRRLGGHPRHRHRGDRPPGPAARDGADPARRVRHHRRGRRGHLGDHRRRGGARRRRDDGRPRHRGRRGRGALRLPGGRRRGAHRRAGRAGGRGRGAVRRGRRVCAGTTAPSRSASRPTTPSGRCSGRAASRPSPRSAGSAPTTSSRTASSPGPRCRRCCAASPRLADEHGVRVANVFHAGDGNLHPLVLFDDARRGRGRAGRGGLRRDPRPVHRVRRLDHRRARRRHGQVEVHAADVHRRRPRHDAAGAVRLRPARARQPRQDLPDAAAVRRGARPPQGRAPAGQEAGLAEVF